MIKFKSLALKQMIYKKNKLIIQIFSDGADFESIKYFNKKKFISGFTTNPSIHG